LNSKLHTSISDSVPTGIDLEVKLIDDKSITLEHFIKHKKEQPFENMRYKGKQTNLAFVFLKSAYSFQRDIDENWTKEQIREYIKINKLVVEKNNEALAVATDIHEKFFSKFIKLQPYADKMIAFGKEHGYVDCPIFPGLRRHVPELLQIGKNLSKEKLKHYSTQSNICVNTGAQGGESLIINKAIVKIQNEISFLSY
jgi:DNA polymerase I-like protein with 3'-5' exonuclease and polymerase domains